MVLLHANVFLLPVKCLCFVEPFREDNAENRIRQALENDAVDTKYGFKRVTDHQERAGFLINMHTVKQFLYQIDVN